MTFVVVRPLNTGDKLNDEILVDGTIIPIIWAYGKPVFQDHQKNFGLSTIILTSNGELGRGPLMSMMLLLIAGLTLY